MSHHSLLASHLDFFLTTSSVPSASLPYRAGSVHQPVPITTFRNVPTVLPDSLHVPVRFNFLYGRDPPPGKNTEKTATASLPSQQGPILSQLFAYSLLYAELFVYTHYCTNLAITSIALSAHDTFSKPRNYYNPSQNGKWKCWAFSITILLL